MTEPTGSQPAEPTPSAPPPAEPAASPTSGWNAPAPAASVPGTAGFVYADVPNRVIALIIDSIILGIIVAIVTGVLYAVVGQPYTVNLSSAGVVDVNYLPLIVGVVVGLAISAAYWVYSWANMGATVGMRILGMRIGSAPDAAPLSQDQALRRWAVLFAPFSLSQIVVGLPLLGLIVSVLTLGYAIYLLWTTYKSPTKQGFHDVFANTVVVKASRSV